MRGCLLSQMDSPPGREAEFHEWYDEEHIPDRLVIPGFGAAMRYEAVDGSPQWLVIYELDDLAAFDRPEYVRLKTEPSDRTRDMLNSVSGFTRYTCELVADAGEYRRHEFVGIEAFVLEGDRAEEIKARSDERILALAEDPRRARLRCYRVLDGTGGPWTHFVVHDLTSAEAWNPVDTDPDGAGWLYRVRSRQEAPAG